MELHQVDGDFRENSLKVDTYIAAVLHSIASLPFEDQGEKYYLQG